MADPAKGIRYKMTWNSTDISGLLSFSSNLSRGELETTDFDSGGWKEFTGTDAELTFSLEIQLEPGDADQETQISEWESGTEQTLTIEPVTPQSGDRTVSVNAYATSVSDSYEKEETITFSVDLRATTEPTISYTS